MESANSTTTKLWLWKNFVDGKPEYWAFDNPFPDHLEPEYWAFDNPFPDHLDCGDPQTLGEPCGYAIFKESRNGRPDVSEEEVLRRMRSTPKISKKRTRHKNVLQILKKTNTSIWYDGVKHGWRMATSRPDASSAPIDRAATAVAPALAL